MQAFCKLIDKSIDLLSEYFGEFIPNYMNSRYESYIRSIGLYRSRPIALDLFQNLVTDKRKQIQQTQEFLAFASEVNQNEASAKTFKETLFLWGGNFGTGLDIFYQTLAKILRAYYEKQDYMAITAEEFVKYENFLNGDSIRIQVIEPIFNFSLDRLDQLDLPFLLDSNQSDKAIIRKIQSNEKTEIMSELDINPSWLFAVEKSEFLIDLEYGEPKIFEESPSLGKLEDIKSRILNLGYAITLLKDNFAGIGYISLRPIIGRRSHNSIEDYDIHDFFPENPKVIKDGEVIRFEEIPIYTL